MHSRKKFEPASSPQALFLLRLMWLSFAYCIGLLLLSVYVSLWAAGALSVALFLCTYSDRFIHHLFLLLTKPHLVSIRRKSRNSPDSRPPVAPTDEA